MSSHLKTQTTLSDQTTGDAGVFLPKLEHDYCLMWEAGPAGALLDYRIRLRTDGR